MKLKRIFSAGLALLLAVPLAGCGLSEDQKIIRGNTSGVYDPAYDFRLTYDYAAYINDESVVVPLSAPDQSMFYYNTHIKTGDENDLSWLYDEIVYCVTHLNSPNEDYPDMCNLTLPKDVTEDQMWTVCLAVASDHPELWYFRLPTLNCFKIHPENSRLVYLYLSAELADIPAMDAMVKAESDKLLASFKGVRLAEDLCAAVAGSLYENNKISDEGFSSTRHSCMYDLLKDHAGTCYAFAQSYCYLLQKLGIPSFIGGGGDPSRLSHTWSIVVLDGIYCYVDVYHMAKEYRSVDHSVSRYLLYKDSSVLLQIHEKFFVLKGFPIAGSSIDNPVISDGSPLKDTYL